VSDKDSKAMNDWIRGGAGKAPPAEAQPEPPAGPPPGNAGSGTSAPPLRKVTMSELIRRFAGRNW